MRTRTLVGAALGGAAMAVALACGAAHAQITEAQKSAIRAACRSDFFANCSSTKPGSLEALKCLQTNVAKLSGGCQAAIRPTIPAPAAPAPQPNVEPPPAPAAAPQSAPIAAPPPPPPAINPPPTEPAKPGPKPKPKPEAKPQPKPKPAPAPSPPPSAAPAAPPPPEIPLARIENLALPARLAIIRACSADRDAVCGAVKAGDGRIIACLAAHRPALSPRCRSTLEERLR